MRKPKTCPRCGKVFMHRGNLNIHLRKKTICPTTYLKINRKEIIDNYDKYYQEYCELPEIWAKKEEVYKPKRKRKNKDKPKLTYKLKDNSLDSSQPDIKNVLEKYFGKVDDTTMKTLTNDLINVIESDDANCVINSNNNHIETHNNNSSHFNNTNFNQNSHNKQLNQQFNITVNAYGQEDLSHLTHKDWKQIIKQKIDAVPALTKKIYIDEETNRNIYIRSFKDGFGLKYNGDRWIPVSMDKLITELLETNTDRLYDYIESDGAIPTKIYNSASTIIDKLSDEKSFVAKRNKMDIKELLIENSHQVLETNNGKIQQ